MVYFETGSQGKCRYRFVIVTIDSNGILRITIWVKPLKNLRVTLSTTESKSKIWRELLVIEEVIV